MATVDYDILIQGNSLKLADGSLGLSSVVLVVAPDGPLLFDTGHYTHRHALIAGLARHGLEPKDVTRVVLSHLHFDHCNNVDLFAEAAVYVSRREWEYARTPARDDLFVPWLIHDLLERRRLELVDGEHEPAPGVRCLPAPGHTPGSYALVLEDTPNGRVVLAGDAIKHARELLAGRSDMVFDPEADTGATIRRLAETADRIVPGHFPELVRRDGVFVWDDPAEFHLVIR
jgi:glyoxylase-like metal-dependent hydrolase (beta-lactamase superfamily II)